MKSRNRLIASGTGVLLAALLAVAAVIIVNSTVTGLRMDLTQAKLFTLSQGTINIIKGLKEPITLDFYYSRKSLVDYPQLVNYANRVRDLLEEYAAHSHGKIKLTVIDPEPFSEEEDQAVAAGLQGISVSAAGDRAYLGLVGVNSTDDEDTIPFFQASREAALEYDITKLVYNLAHPKKRVVGVISSLPVMGSAYPTQKKPWAIIKTLREFFSVRDLGQDVKDIDSDIDVLMVIHPKKLKDATMYAIDQYLLKGGRALLFVDPLAESDPSQPDPQNPYTIPDLDSDMKFLLDGWGVKVLDGKVAGDITAAMRVQTRSTRGPQETNYLPWLHLDNSYLNHDDFITGQLEVVNMGTAGIIEKEEKSTVKLTPLIQTSAQSAEIERDLILFQSDPNVMLNNFKPDNRRLTLAARITGHVKTAFPDGAPVDPDAKDKGGADQTVKEGDVNVILVADTDILSDMFWVRMQNYFGVEVPQPIANNGDFVVNAIENLSGSNDLISLRSRGEFSRPFEVVENIRREAEKQFRDREQALQSKLEETEKKMRQLQQEGGDSNMILSPEQTRELEQFREDQVKTRKELRAVQHDLQRNIEELGTKLKFINIGLMPLLIALLALGAGLYRTRRRS